jgi:hypothetical protein
MEHLIGIWIYTSLIYQGMPYPRPDANLQMQFVFNSESENQIHYFRKNEPGHCERTAKYVFKDNKLYQKVISVDPSNSPECADDPDMQIGRESESDLEVYENCMYLTLPLGEETLTYVWQKADGTGESCAKK